MVGTRVKYRSIRFKDLSAEAHFLQTVWSFFIYSSQRSSLLFKTHQVLCDVFTMIIPWELRGEGVCTAIKVGSSYQIFLKALDEWNNTGSNHDSLVFKDSENAALTMSPALAQRWRYLWGWDKKDTSVSKSLTSQVSHFVRNHKADVCTELSYEFKNKQTNPPRSYRQHLLTLHK